MVENQRGDNLFMQEDELGCLERDFERTWNGRWT